MKDKLQVCLSFKNTNEERELYEYIISQSDKSVFLKNLIRQHRNGYKENITIIKPNQVKEDVVEEVKPVKLNHGNKTKSKFLS